MKPSTVPLLTATLLTVLLTGWAITAKRQAEERARQEIHRTAQTLFSAMKGSIQANLRRGRGHKARIATILKNITETTQLNHFEIRQGDQIITTSGAIEAPALPSAEGTLLSDTEYWMWKTVELQDHTPHSYPNEGGHAGGRFADTDIDFNQNRQLILLGLDAAGYYQEVKHAFKSIYILLGTGMLAAWILMAAWSFILRNRQLSAQLEREQIRAEHLSDLQLAGAGLAHETKNPLGLIRGIAQQISGTEAAPEAVKELATDIMEQADVATARLGEFIAFSRKRLPAVEEIDLQSAAGRICDLMLHDAEHNGIGLRNEVHECRVTADPGMLSQILINLISNALHACRKDDSIGITATCNKAEAELRISDTGTGIPAELLPEIFKPYVTGRENGHGLGLAIVRRMVEDHGWQIRVESTEHRKTDVIISGIPCRNGEHIT